MQSSPPTQIALPPIRNIANSGISFDSCKTVILEAERIAFWHLSKLPRTPTANMVLGRLTHYAFDAVLFSAFLAGMQRSTGLSVRTEKIGADNKEIKKWVDKYLGVGEWVMDQSIAIASSSAWFERKGR